MKTIRVSDEVYIKLQELKIHLFKEKHLYLKSLNKVVEWLVNECEKARFDPIPQKKS